VKDATKSGMIN